MDIERKLWMPTLLSYRHLILHTELLFQVTCSRVESADILTSDVAKVKCITIIMMINVGDLLALANVRVIMGGLEHFICFSVFLEHIIGLLEVYIV